ncbi:MAG TPA: LysE family translocator [Gaiellaceae bacterium]|nr:LysE family translocator [Gaiellaceae bacterium]
MIQNLGAFLLLSAVVICTPGPDTALIIRNTLAAGRRAGVATAVGIIGGITVWTLAASLGLAALLSASEPVFRAIQLAGAAYLVYLGAQSLWWARRGRERANTGKTVAMLTPRRALRQGLLSNLGNPKIAVFFVSLLPQFVTGGSRSFVALLVLGCLFSALGLAWLTLYAVAVARMARLLTGAVRRTVDALTGLVLVALGLRLATERSP